MSDVCTARKFLYQVADIPDGNIRRRLDRRTEAEDRDLMPSLGEPGNELKGRACAAGRRFERWDVREKE